jgi:hypothetical protein
LSRFRPFSCVTRICVTLPGWVAAAAVLAGAFSARGQFAQSATPQTQAPGKGPGGTALPSRPIQRRPAQSTEQDQIDSNQALFTVLAAINAAGYDDQNNSPSTHPFRHTLRARLAARNLDSVYELKRFYRDHAIKDPKAEFSRYILKGYLRCWRPSTRKQTSLSSGHKHSRFTSRR